MSAQALANNTSRVILYQVDLRYDPAEHDGHEANDCINIEVGDVVEIESTDGNVSSQEGWLRGKNCRTGCVGFFPQGYVTEKPKQPGQRPVPRVRPKKQQAIDCDGTHKLKRVYFVRPVLCAFCSDYIWGTDSVGKQCEGCSKCYHDECEDLLRTSIGPANVCQSQAPPLTPPYIRLQPVALEEWENENILEWMAVVNLGRYVQIFKKVEISGKNIRTVTPDYLEKLLIKDEFHKDAILACTSALCDWGSSIIGPVLAVEDGKASDHNLDIYCFTTLLHCHICGRALWGLWHQGFQCRACGLRCHRKCVVCKLPRCNPELLHVNAGASVAEDGLFGLELNDNGNPPPIVELCTRELETKAQQPTKGSPAKLILDAYRLPVSVEDIQQLKKTFASARDIRSVDLSTYKLSCIAGALKKYLRELPTSVIPPPFYSRLITESRKTEEQGCLQGMRDLVSELPANHALTLNIIMTHLSNICRMSSNSQDPSSKLAQVFCHVLIRPPWESVIETVYNMDDHYRAVLRILICQEWNFAMDDLPPVIPPRTLSYLDGATVHRRPPGTNTSLDDMEWYWGDTKKEVIATLMSGTPDGTFVVRDATDRTQGTMYTLTVRKGGANMLLRVYERGGRVSLSETLDFGSLVELVEHHKRNTLASYNKKLTIVLETPLPRIISPTPSSELSTSRDERQFLLNHVEFVLRTEEYSNMQAELNRINEEVQTKQLYLLAARETVSMLDGHWRLSASNREIINTSDMERVDANIELIKSKLSKAEEMCTSLDDEIFSSMQELRNLQNNLNVANRRLNDLQKSSEDLRLRLMGSGCARKTLEQVIETSNQWIMERGAEARSVELLWSYLDTTVLHAPSLPHLDSRTWQSLTFDRDQAETLLKTRPEGTFLIRPSKEGPDALALSIVCRAEPLHYAERHALSSELTVVHCKIDRTETGYGFADPYYIHETLTDLVLHYQSTSLVEHNDSLDVTLMYPAFAPNTSAIGGNNGGSIANGGSQSYIYFDAGSRPRPTTAPR